MTTQSPPPSGPPLPTSDAVRKRMENQKTKNTKPEVRLRRVLHARGLRYRLHRNVLSDRRRTQDVVFPRERVAVDVYGCFWHGCPEHYVAPKANARFWAEKIDSNRERDAHTSDELAQVGWVHIVVWEHESPERAADLVEQTVLSRRSMNQ